MWNQLQAIPPKKIANGKRMDKVIQTTREIKEALKKK
jgi:hypothetical protein